MPENHLGLKFFQIKAEALIADRTVNENIIELALEALKSKRNDPVDYIVNMPEFRIDTNIEATELLRKVFIYQYLFEIICFLGQLSISLSWVVKFQSAGFKLVNINAK